MEVCGKLCTCDRCGAQVFLKTTGEGEADGGFTRWNKFEPYPEGWDEVAVPKSANASRANAYNSYLRTCPECTALWKKVINEGFLKGTPYYKKEAST